MIEYKSDSQGMFFFFSISKNLNNGTIEIAQIEIYAHYTTIETGHSY